MPQKVLVVDDESGIRQVLKECLSKYYSVDTAVDGLDAKRLLEKNEYDVLILDMHLPGMNGMEVYKWVEGANPQLADRTMFITCVSSYPSYEKFARTNASRCFSKPFMIDELVAAVDRIFKQPDLVDEEDKNEGAS
jgi:DNA-binding NtrC family response regulator